MMSFFPVSPTMPSFAAALGVALQATALLLLAWGATSALRKSSAALRHLLWTLAVCSCLALPALAIFPPSVALAVPDLETIYQTSIFQRALETPDPNIPATHFSRTESRLDSSTLTYRPDDEISVAFAALERKRFIARCASIVSIVWGLGALLVFVRLTFGLGRLWVLTRRSKPLDCPQWSEARDEIMHSLKLQASDVRLRASKDVFTPFVWGVCGVQQFFFQSSPNTKRINGKPPCFMSAPMSNAATA